MSFKIGKSYYIKYMYKGNEFDMHGKCEAIDAEKVFFKGNDGDWLVVLNEDITYSQIINPAL